MALRKISIPPKDLTILFIEDNELIRTATLMTLHDALEANIIIAENVAEACAALKKQVFDFVISDLGLPDGTGNDIVSATKSNPDALNYTTPFFALTAHSDQNKRKEAERAGFLMTIIKPLSRNKLALILERYSKTRIEDIIDFKWAETQLEGHHPELIMELLEILAAELSNDLQHLQLLFENNQIKPFLGEIHKLKGGIAHCGMPRLYAAICELEKRAKTTHDLKSVNVSFNDFLNESQRFLQAYQALQ